MATKNYKIHLISNNENLRRKLYNVAYFEEIIMSTSLDDIQEEITIIDDKIFTINDLLKNKHKISSDYIFYQISRENFKFSTKSILESNNIRLLQPYMTDENIVEYICSEVIKHYKYTVNKNIITFFGADSKVGTTQVAQSIAEKIVDKSYARVCLVFLDGEPGTDYLSTHFKNNIDTIKIKLISGLATVEEIFDIAEKVKENLLVIEGTKSILYRKEYQPEHISYLLNILSLACDLVVVDAGSCIDRAMPIAALISTNYRYLVTTQQANSLRRYLAKQPILERLSLDDFQVIVNKHMPDGSLLTTYDIARTYGHPFLSKIEFTQYALQAENDRKSLIHYKDKAIDRDMDKLADVIINQININKKEAPKKESSSERKGWVIEMDNLDMYKEAFYNDTKVKEFDLEKYIYSVTGEKREEVINITRDELTRFRILCDTIFGYFHSQWDREGLETSTLIRQKNAILGKELEVKYFKDNIEDYLKRNNKLMEWYPNWYLNLVDAIYQECWGLGGIAQWKYSKKYALSQSAKIIGNRIYFMENGKMKLQQQTITDDRRKQLIKALLLNEKNIHYDGKHAEVSMHDGIRITIYGEKLVKDNLEVIIFRKYIIPKLSFEEQVKRNTIPNEAIPMLKNMVNIGYNVIFTGAVRTGKTTFLETWQMYEDTTLEGVMIETGAEIPSHKLQPYAPIIQLVADDEELGNIIKPILRSDADYIISAEARDGRALNVSMRAANKGTRRCKTTYHTTDPTDICYDIADEIVKFYGGDLYNTIFKVAKSFHYVFHFIQLADKSKKRLKGIYEIRFNRHVHKISVHPICKYDYSQDSWQFKYDIGEDKEELGHEEDKIALANFKRELKKLEDKYPNHDYLVYEPKYEGLKG